MGMNLTGRCRYQSSTANRQANQPIAGCRA